MKEASFELTVMINAIILVTYEPVKYSSIEPVFDTSMERYLTFYIQSPVQLIAQIMIVLFALKGLKNVSLS